MFTILHRQQDISEAQNLFRSVVYAKATEDLLITVGYQGGNELVKAKWLGQLGFWAYFGDPPPGKSIGERYWNVFGTTFSARNTANITCEINSPVAGINRRVFGAFARDESHGTVILHRGRLNGISKESFCNHYQQRNRWVKAIDGDRDTRFVLVGALSDPDFTLALSSFILEAERIKQTAKTT